MSTLKLVAAIVLAFIVCWGIVAAVQSATGADDEVDCAVENVDRTMNGYEPIYCPRD